MREGKTPYDEVQIPLVDFPCSVKPSLELVIESFVEGFDIGMRQQQNVGSGILVTFPEQGRDRVACDFGWEWCNLAHVNVCGNMVRRDLTLGLFVVVHQSRKAADRASTEIGHDVIGVDRLQIVQVLQVESQAIERKDLGDFWNDFGFGLGKQLERILWLENWATTYRGEEGKGGQASIRRETHCCWCLLIELKTLLVDCWTDWIRGRWWFQRENGTRDGQLIVCSPSSYGEASQSCILITTRFDEPLLA